MNRRIFVKTSMLAAAGAAVPAFAKESGEGKVGKLDPAEFKKINMDAGVKVAAIKPGAEPLSKADEKLMMQVAMGGMMQLETSNVAVKMATSPDVRAIAEAEVEEQTGLSAKLAEIAAAKNVTLPAAPDEKTQKMVEKLQAMKGAEFDKTYLKEIGVKGHELLQTTMGKVKSTASDATLKTVATTTLPLIKTHLQVSTDEMASMA